MKVAELLESRRENWQHLDKICAKMESRRKRGRDPADMTRFAALYRSACADLALAEAYQLPTATVLYLHQLVGRAHNQLYPSRRFRLGAWRKELLFDVPQRLFSDGCVWLAFTIFWGVFLISMLLASEAILPGASRPPMRGYAESLIGQDMLQMYQEMHSDGPSGDSGNLAMAGFYIWHNTGIGLKCFAFGLIFGIGGLLATVFNAAYLGAIIGYMTRVPERDNFFNFITAHGPFEMTAIVLSAAAGMRLGFALVNTGRLSRIDSLRQAGVEAMPTMGVAMVLFFLAAVVESFVSPTGLPYVVKALVATVSTGLLVFYFVMLGWPTDATDATG